MLPADQVQRWCFLNWQQRGSHWRQPIMGGRSSLLVLRVPVGVMAPVLSQTLLPPPLC